MTTAPYFHVDAFADRPFTGNQAAVLLLDRWPADSELQAIAAENNFAETAFAVTDGTGAADYELRWFTPATEVRMCGHATLATGFVVLGREAERSAVRFRTREVGTLEVRRAGAALELALPAIATSPADWPEAVAAIGAVPAELRRSPLGYTVLVYADEGQVRALRPDFGALAALGNELFVATAAGRDCDIVSRAFAPGAGIDEDPVTGTAHALVAPIWAQRLARDRLSAFQASQRGGRLTCRLDGDRVWLGGSCVVVAEGRYYF